MKFYRLIKKILRLIVRIISNTNLFISFLERIKSRTVDLSIDPCNKNVLSKIIPIFSRYNSNKRVVIKNTNFDIGKVFKMNLNINEFTQCGYFFGNFDYALISILKRKGGIFIDIGSNVGLYSLAASHFFDKVLSFEPSYYTYSMLEKNVSINNIKNITLFRNALSDFEGEVELFVNPLNNGGSSISGHSTKLRLEHKNLDWHNSEKVLTKKLDCVLDGISQSIDFIKIDVEGHEIEVIKGGIKNIVKHLPLLYVEISGDIDRYYKVLDLLPDEYSSYAHTDEKHNTKKFPSDLLFATTSKAQNLKDFYEYRP